ncbi:MAG: hypothetical protein N3B18_01115 [Desulfobacterota bacterium]|nr:hypothetical protein [Thermodesulfobacteriota bacterium]
MAATPRSACDLRRLSEWLKRSTLMNSIISPVRAHIKNMLQQHYVLGVLIAGLLTFSPTAHAGGPLNTAAGRSVVYSPSSFPIPYMVDQGDLGAIDNAQATTLVDTCFATWQAVPTACISFVNAGHLAENVTGERVFDYFNDADGINPILFDADGSIIDTVFGLGAKQSVIGFAGSEYNGATGYYTEGLAVINGLFSTKFSYDQFKATFVHEFGHFIGLDHSQINGQYVGDGNTVNDIYVPTMYPTATDDDTTLASLNPDDMAALTLLYPEHPALVDAVYGKLQGTVVWCYGMPVLGANVVAYNIADENMLRFSSVSDYFRTDTGFFEMLVPPGTYRLYVEPINRDFYGGSSVGPYAQTPFSLSFTQQVRTAYYPEYVTVSAGDTTTLSITAVPAFGSRICPVERVFGDTATETQILRAFRDNILATTHQGNTYIHVFESYASELNALLENNASLQRSCRHVLKRFADNLQVSGADPNGKIDPALWHEIKTLCRDILKVASPGLQRVITAIVLSRHRDDVIASLFQSRSIHNDLH